MSAPRCLRLAIEACRPVRSSTLRPQATFSSRRTYASKPKHGDPSSITEGFPTPFVPGQPVKENTPEEKQLYEQIQDLSPKPTPLPIARPQPAGSESSVQHLKNTTSKTEAIVKPDEQKKSSGSQFISISEEDDIETKPNPPSTSKIPIPPNVLAAYHTPLKHQAPHGVPVASLQLRSYSVRNLEFFVDFALRAAFYLNLPASGPVPLPKIIERWTMPRSNFVHKKSQENFERITRRRLITVKDGDTSVVEIWLAFLRKWQFYGVGMKANVWQWESLDVADKLDTQFASAEVEKELHEKLANFGFNRTAGQTKSLQRMMDRQGMNHVGSPMTDLRDASKTAEQRM